MIIKFTNSNRILTKNYSKPLATLGPFTKNPLTHIIIPKYYPITLRNPSKYLEQLTKPIVFDKEGNIYFFSLDQDFQVTSSPSIYSFFNCSYSLHMLKIQLKEESIINHLNSYIFGKFHSENNSKFSPQGLRAIWICTCFI